MKYVTDCAAPRPVESEPTFVTLYLFGLACDIVPIRISHLCDIVHSMFVTSYGTHLNCIEPPPTS